MRTHSPGLGISSCSNPRSTLRRTPTTSISAVFRWSDGSEKISTICPGMAKHMPSHFLSSQNVKREFQLVLDLQPAPCNRDQFDVIVRLPQRKRPKSPQRIARQLHSCRDRLRARNAVHGQITIECDRILPFANLGGGEPRALVDDLRIG